VNDDLRRRVADLEWYHTIELAPGVVTPGWFDLRGVVAEVPIPMSLAGARVLDIGTFDGFWAFEMERRGAAEVVAIDVLDPAGWDWPLGSDDAVVQAIGQRKAKGAGFLLAKDALGSSVHRLERSVYDLDASEVGSFDFVYVGSLLLHLRDPIRALERVRGVAHGSVVVVDAVDGLLTAALRGRPAATLDGVGRPWWWKPNVAGLVRMVEVAGFELTEPAKQLRLPAGRGQPRPSPRVALSRAGRAAAWAAWRGDLHAAVPARAR
jgi:tRNA (mo5U34)-methyltransferase